jgi:hypothetical protein
MLRFGFNQIYPTNVYYDRIWGEKKLNEIVGEILSLYDVNSVEMGEQNLFVSTSKIIRECKIDIVEHFDYYLRNHFYRYESSNYTKIVNGWISSNGDISKHNHAGSHFTGVFFLMADNKDSIGFTDPRTNANRGYPRELQFAHDDLVFTPNSGDCLIFPSFLYHYVKANTDKLKLCVAVDLTLVNKDLYKGIPNDTISI